MSSYSNMVSRIRADLALPIAEDGMRLAAEMINQARIELSEPPDVSLESEFSECVIWHAVATYALRKPTPVSVEQAGDKE